MVAAAVTADPARRGANRRVVIFVRWAAPILAAAAGGVLLYASFPPRTVWWLAPVGFGLLGAAVRGRRVRAGFGLGCLFGLGFLLPLLSWTGSYVGWPWLFLPAAEALFVAAAVAGMAVVSRLPAAPVLAAAVWVAGEALRGRVPFGGFPWGKVAFGQADGPYLPIAALGGAPLLSFAVVLTGLALAELLRKAALAMAKPLRPETPRTEPATGKPSRTQPSRTEAAAGKPSRTEPSRTEAAMGELSRNEAGMGELSRTEVPKTEPFRTEAFGTGAGRGEPGRSEAVGRALFVSAVGVVLPLVVALAVAPTVDTTAQAGTRTVALVQGNVPRAGLDFNAQRRAVLDNHAQRTEQLAQDVRAGRQPQPDLVLWPENAADIDPIRNQDAAAVVDLAAGAIRAPVLLGAILDPPADGPFNAVVLWQPGSGPTAQYIKRHVQPFGEYIPMRRVARWFSAEVDRVRRPLQGGDQVGVLEVAGTRVAIATCYEVAFDGIVRDAVKAGGTVIAVPTNNATFGFTEMTYQQLAMSRVRAVEHSRAVLVAATSGVSAVITPDGTVRQHTGLFTADALVADVPLRTTTTLATRLGAAPEWLLVTIGLAALLGSAARRRRGTGKTPQEHSDMTVALTED